MIRAAVVGATGYAGAELVRLLAGHPGVTVTVLTSRQYAGQLFSDVYPAVAGQIDLSCQAFSAETVADQADVVFTALPHQLPMDIVPDLLNRGCRVVDLSADFRFSDVATYEAYYQPHAAADLCQISVYGLSEVYREAIASADLVGNPGCYPTSVLLALVPLVQAELLEVDQIIADVKSGLSGAGRSPSLGTHLCEISESVKAYKVDAHRHAPEMVEVLSRAAGQPVTLTFVPHLMPMIRGMLSTVYVGLRQAATVAEVLDVLSAYYEGRPFIRLCAAGDFPETRFVRGTNYCDIGVSVDADAKRLIIVSAIDNLLKGAAGQAVQNMNIMFGIDEQQGLDMIPFPV